MITRDFSLAAYQQYLSAFKQAGYRFGLFREYIKNQGVTGKLCLIRHDVDRKPGNALDMAKLEQSMGIVATYYFRFKKGIFVPEIIKEIQLMGHEVGYHYENLSDTDGNHPKALLDFEKNLATFRQTAEVSTISMHGRPFKPYDNRDLWKVKENHDRLKQWNISGEVYLDIDYKDIAYINDTGRNWQATRNNIRDITNSELGISFDSGNELLTYLSSGNSHSKVVFQIHPERWDKNFVPWLRQYFLDFAINSMKQVIIFTKKLKG